MVVVAVPSGEGGAVQFALGVLGNIVNWVKLSYAAEPVMIKNGTYKIRIYVL